MLANAVQSVAGAGAGIPYGAETVYVMTGLSHTQGESKLVAV